MSSDNKIIETGKTQEPKSETPSTELIVFFSFDLVNSTKYKYLEPQDWPSLIEFFYTSCRDGFRKKDENVNVWKFLGEKILLFRVIEKSIDIPKCIQNAYKVLQETLDAISNYCIRNDKEQGIILSVKSTVWCARVLTEYNPKQNVLDKGMHRNIKLFPVTDGGTPTDFLGPQVDIGFRIAKFSSRKRQVISAELAYILLILGKHASGIIEKNPDELENDKLFQNIQSNLRIVDYEKLKGAWGGRMYPILWYDEFWPIISETFEYDEKLESELIGRIVDEGEESLGKSDELKKIFKSLPGTGGREEAICKDILEGKFSEVAQISHHPKVEIHCSAVCFNSSGQALVLRRNPSSKLLDNKWEFGCAHMKNQERFEDCLTSGYKKDYNLTLAFGQKLMPVSTYYIETSGVAGIIFVAQVVDESTLRVDEKRYSEVKWISHHSHKIKEAEAVNDFNGVLNKAYKIWQDHLKD